MTALLSPLAPVRRAAGPALQRKTRPATRGRRRIPTFTPVPTRGRTDGWTVGRQACFVAALVRLGSVRGAARHVGLSRASAYKLRGHPEAQSFARAWDEALGAARAAGQVALRKLTLAALWQRALHGVVQPVMLARPDEPIYWKQDNKALLHLMRRFRRSGACTAPERAEQRRKKALHPSTSQPQKRPTMTITTNSANTPANLGADLAIRMARAAFNRALAAGDLAAITPILCPDVMLVTGTDSAVITGKKAQLQAWKREFSAPAAQRTIYTRTPDTITPSAVEPIAMELGHWQGADAQGRVQASGSYAAKWRNRGQWVLEAEIFVTLA